MEKFTNIEQLFIEHLQEFHLGKRNAVTARNLAQFGCPREIRKLVNTLRTKNVPICSGDVGYYYASNAEELDETLKFLYSHASKVLQAYHGLVASQNKMHLEEFYSKEVPKVADQLSLF